MSEKVPRRKEKIWYGPFPIYDEGWIVGRADLSVIYRGCWRQNLHIKIYSKGKYPYFNLKNLEAQYTVRIPLPVSDDLLAELKARGIRVRKNEEHKWKKKIYKAKVVKDGPALSAS